MTYFTTEHPVGERFEAPPTSEPHHWTLVSAHPMYSPTRQRIVLICLWQRNEAL